MKSAQQLMNWIIFDFQIFKREFTKKIVEKCGKVLTYSHFLYLCSVIWHEICHH